mgnify:FL=1
MKRNDRKRILAAVLCTVLAAGMTGCGKTTVKDAGSNPKESTPIEDAGYHYRAEWLTQEETDSSGTEFRNISVTDNVLYYARAVYTDNGDTQNFCRMNLENSPVKEETLPALTGSIVTAVDADTFAQVQEDNNRMILRKLSADGTVMAETDITDLTDGETIQDCLADAEGNVYLSDNKNILIFDKELALTDTILLTGSDNPDAGNTIGITGDGRVVVLKYGAGDTELFIYDKEKKSFGDACSGIPSGIGNSSLSFTEDGSALLGDSEGAYLYNPESRTATRIVKWMDCDLNPDYVREIYAVSDDNFVVLYNDWNTNRNDIVFLKKAAAEDTVREKTVITVGTLYAGQGLQTDVVNFNKNSEEYRVEIKDYASYAEYTTEEDYEKRYQESLIQINNDIVNGAIDMFTPDVADIGNLISKGAVEDLNSYLDASTQLNKSDFVESIINSVESSGMLYCIPTDFSINTLVGKTEDVGETSGWTMADVKALCDRYPDAKLFPYSTRTTVLDALLTYDFESYVDWENGVCHFDEEPFKQLLEMVSKYPSDEEFNFDTDYISNPKAFRTHTALLDNLRITDVTGYQIEQKVFDAPITAIGYPTNGTKSGVAAKINGGVCINSASKEKDACWSFIEYSLAHLDTESGFIFGFPVKTVDLEAMFEKKLKEQDKSYNMTWDDVEITVDRVTDNDIEMLRKLIGEIDSIASDRQNTSLMNIITEEAEAYFKGQKTLNEVTDIIQSRATIYVNETKQ